MATLQQQVQQYLDNTGISLRELSRRSGVSHTTISKILRGGTYKSDTAHALYSLISITPISEYVTLHDKVEAIAADRVDHDKGWDVDLNCAKYRRVMQLEAEAVKARVQADELKTELECSRIDVRRMQDVLAQREQHLRSCENALIEAHEKLNDSQHQHGRAIMLLSDERKEVQRLTALSETHGQSWKAACVQVEHLQKQLDHGQTAYSKLHNQLGATRTKYETQLEKANQKDVQREEYLVKTVENKIRMEKQIMRLRVYVWILFAALVFVVASGLVVWGAV